MDLDRFSNGYTGDFIKQRLRRRITFSSTHCFITAKIQRDVHCSKLDEIRLLILICLYYVFACIYWCNGDLRKIIQ